MSGLVNLLLPIAVLALVVRRQLRPQRLDTERRFWLVPLILGGCALRDPQLVDPGRVGPAVALLAVALLATLAMGCVWGWTVRLWCDDEGTLWARGTKATAAAWAGLIAVRLGVYGVGRALHIDQRGAGLLLGLAILLLVRGAVVNWRARELGTARPAPVLH